MYCAEFVQYYVGRIHNIFVKSVASAYITVSKIVRSPTSHVGWS